MRAALFTRWPTICCLFATGRDWIVCLFWVGKKPLASSSFSTSDLQSKFSDFRCCTAFDNSCKVWLNISVKKLYKYTNFQVSFFGTRITAPSLWITSARPLTFCHFIQKFDIGQTRTGNTVLTRVRLMAFLINSSFSDGRVGTLSAGRVEAWADWGAEMICDWAPSTTLSTSTLLSIVLLEVVGIVSIYDRFGSYDMTPMACRRVRWVAWTCLQLVPAVRASPQVQLYPSTAVTTSVLQIKHKCLKHLL